MHECAFSQGSFIGHVCGYHDQNKLCYKFLLGFLRTKFSSSFDEGVISVDFHS